jgi:hypothetical protein
MPSRVLRLVSSISGVTVEDRCYSLHGLAVSSNQAIPGLPRLEPRRDADLRITFGRLPFAVASGSQVWFETPYQTSTGEPVLTASRLQAGRYYRITYVDGIDFVINQRATRVWVTWPAALSVNDVPSYLLGPIVGVVLRLRGVTCLHASCIEIDGQAIGFVGPAGVGKSTIAAAFGVRGVPVLSDDTIALRRVENGWVALPGNARVRLWPESAWAVREQAGALALLAPGESGSTTRYHLDLMAPGCRFRREPIAVGAIYLLDEALLGSDLPRAQTMTPADALMALVANTYATRVLDRSTRAAEFDTLGDLVANVPVRRLTRPSELARLPEFCEFILDDLHSIGLPRQIAAAR